jgi:FkbM family methyltransferase
MSGRHHPGDGLHRILRSEPGRLVCNIRGEDGPTSSRQSPSSQARTSYSESGGSVCGQANSPSSSATHQRIRDYCDLSDAVQRSLFYLGTYEPRTSSLIKTSLGRSDTFLDVGANAGHYTFLAAREVGPSGCGHAIEASGETAGALLSDIRSNRLEAFVKVHHVAAGATAGKAMVRERTDELSPIGTRYIASGGDGDEVAVVPVDELLPDSRPAVVKVDVEAADLQSLQGMRRTIERACPRLIVVEVDDAMRARFGDSAASLAEYLGGLGYRGEPIH